MRFMANSPSAARQHGCAKGLNFWVGRASTTKPRPCHPIRGLRLFGVFRAVLVGRPEVRPAYFGQPLGLGPPPGPDLAMVAAGQEFRDRLALEQGGAGVVRVLQQALGKALLGPRSLLAHDAGNEPDAGVEQRE